ncbi:uncharacterized protein LOC132606104 [Lycium barbarum]|uniref:uncharacterized protein LOC132606104 n=1 Tax=Lycium barbarum TaxID=112863 RepID=UPI00293ED50A|nr:uncharacterized protein LOC132606104 [Lycium barbarum]
MGVKVATTCLQWTTQPFVPHSPSSSQTFASPISSKKRSISNKGSLICRYVHRLDQSALLDTQSLNLYRSKSCDIPKPRTRTIRRANSTSASLDSFSDEEFSKEIQELALKFQFSDVENPSTTRSQREVIESVSSDGGHDIKFLENQRPFDPLEQPDWPERDEIIPANIEWKANSVDLPFSLRIIKRKKQWQDGIREAGESAYCSVKKAFSNMVFIIRELQSYTLQMREMLFYEDLQGILVRVQKEMHASFVWLFQQVFSHTPTLMVYVMILLANYSVHSMASSFAIAATPPPLTESVSTLDESNLNQRFDSSTLKTFSVSSSSSGKTTSIGGNNGGGGTYKPIASGNDGDGTFDRRMLTNGISSIGSSRVSEEECVSGQETREEELQIWNSIVHEASKMQASMRDEALDHETMQRFVSPIHANIEVDDYADYFRTELLYQMGLTQEPQNTLLLANYAQFLFLVAQDYDRAEEYFKKAAEVEPKDAEALNKYATFLWQVRKDLWAAEETYLEALAAEPDNSFYAANYANFLWNTGGEDTCFPLDSPDTDI